MNYNDPLSYVQLTRGGHYHEELQALIPSYSPVALIIGLLSACASNGSGQGGSAEEGENNTPDFPTK